MPTSYPIKAIKCFFRMALLNIKASKILYDADLPNYAIFHLQQSIESGFKCYAFTLEIISTPAEVKKEIGHSTSKLRIITIKKIINELNDFIPANSPARSKIQEMLETQDYPIINLTEKIPDLTNIPEKRLVKIIDSIDSDIKRLPNFEEIFSPPTDDSLSEFLLFLLNTPIERFPHRFPKKMKFTAKHIKKLEFYFAMSDYDFFVFQAFTSLSLIFENHVQSTRYIDRGMHCPDLVYSEDNPLIKNYSRIVDIVDASIKVLDIFIGYHLWNLGIVKEDL